MLSAEVFKAVVEVQSRNVKQEIEERDDTAIKSMQWKFVLDANRQGLSARRYVSAEILSPMGSRRVVREASQHLAMSDCHLTGNRWVSRIINARNVDKACGLDFIPIRIL